MPPESISAIIGVHERNRINYSSSCHRFDFCGRNYRGHYHRCESKSKKKRSQQLNQLIDSLITQSNAEYFIIDTRPQADYESGHIPGAYNIELETIPSFYPTERMFSNIIVTGSSDREAEKAASILSKTAYFRVSSLGSFKRWKGTTETGKGPDLSSLQK